MCVSVYLSEGLQGARKIKKKKYMQIQFLAQIFSYDNKSSTTKKKSTLSLINFLLLPLFPGSA